MKRLLLLSLLFLPTFCWSGGPKYNHKNALLDEEFENNYHDHSFPNIVYGKASTMTVTQLNVSSVTMTGSLSGLSITSLNLTTGTVQSFMVLGTVTNDDAPLGRLGQYISATGANANFPASGTYDDMASISLTAGDWDVSGQIAQFINGAVVTGVRTGISATTGNSFPEEGPGYSASSLAFATAGTGLVFGIHTVRISVAATTSIYLKRRADYTSGPPTSSGKIWARRVF